MKCVNRNPYMTTLFVPPITLIVVVDKQFTEIYKHRPSDIVVKKNRQPRALLRGPLMFRYLPNQNRFAVILHRLFNDKVRACVVYEHIRSNIRARIYIYIFVTEYSFQNRGISVCVTIPH